MKKITVLSLIVIMLCLTACGKKDEEKPEDNKKGWFPFFK
jgi:hypothetical protein